jgi:hypothetical protein
VKIERLDIGNADITGDVTGTYRTLPTGPGEIDIVARASRGSAKEAHRTAAIDRSSHRRLAQHGARRRQRGRCEASDHRQSRRLSVRQQQGRQAHVHLESEGRGSLLTRKAGPRSTPSTPT